MEKCFLFEHYSMLNKSPSLRPSAAEILKAPYMEEHLQVLNESGVGADRQSVTSHHAVGLRVGEESVRKEESRFNGGMNTRKTSLQRRPHKLWFPDATRHGKSGLSFST